MIFADESQLQIIGEKCFSESALEEIAIPSTLREIRDSAFDDCSHLRIVWVKEGCAANVRKCVGKSVVVISDG